MDLFAGFDQRDVGFPCSETLAVGPAHLASDVVNGEGICVMTVFNQAVVDACIHGVELVATLVVVEIAGMDDAYQAHF